ncbi:flagellar basal body P-ring formation chaperone FlgA [Methylobacterium platani]|uniref:Flagellar biosynthesis protein FlgA n=2 Tax=Methylobacterium platani TaxID=427683 RepID=A0A179S9R6_9HYPH|nr:flagellar basal body P-ring formation chaperone FlgA [Methylobacterium platani]KMO12807.1 flagellar basal body P-ring biosynthesis protein FlgA [Methylobacterium platani JCM 14648]OAS24538.1 flagellar biosynthesis protein FlgA [Methylobacterium platani]
MIRPARPARTLAAPQARRMLLGPGILSRTALTLLALGALTLPVLAGEAPRLALKGDITAERDVITLGDLVAGAPPALAHKALFRAPALGTSGTIQVRRIVEATAGLGLDAPESGGRLQISVQRAARRIAAPEIEGALKAALAKVRGIDTGFVTVAFEGEPPVLTVPPDLIASVTAQEVTYDPRSRRVTALVVVGERQASLRVSGQLVEMADVAVLTRSINRGETLSAPDIAVERRPRDGLPADIAADAAAFVGQVAQKPLGAGTALRSGELTRPDLVARGEAVTIVYETPGVALALRGQAREGGPLGAVIGVINPVSKKVIQATVIGPGRVTVAPIVPVTAATPAAPGRLASARP